jgi:hypothetical protein
MSGDEFGRKANSLGEASEYDPLRRNASIVHHTQGLLNLAESGRAPWFILGHRSQERVGIPCVAGRLRCEVCQVRKIKLLGERENIFRRSAPFVQKNYSSERCFQRFSSPSKTMAARCAWTLGRLPPPRLYRLPPGLRLWRCRMRSRFSQDILLTVYTSGQSVRVNRLELDASVTTDVRRAIHVACE